MDSNRHAATGSRQQAPYQSLPATRTAAGPKRDLLATDAKGHLSRPGELRRFSTTALKAFDERKDESLPLVTTCQGAFDDTSCMRTVRIFRVGADCSSLQRKGLKLAVRVGFEPTEPVKVQRFSRPPDSTALAPHRVSCGLLPLYQPRLFRAFREAPFHAQSDVLV